MKVVALGPKVRWLVMKTVNSREVAQTEIEEELAEYIECQQGPSMIQELLISEANHGKKDSQHGEAHELNWLASNGVHESNSDPVARNCTSTDKDQVAHSGVVEDFVHGVAFRVTYGAKDDGVIETEAVESDLQISAPWSLLKVIGGYTHIEEKPRARCTNENLSMLPLPVVTHEVLPACLWDFEGSF